MKNIDKYLKESGEGEGMSWDIPTQHIVDIKKYLEDVSNSEENEEIRAERKRLLGIVTKWMSSMGEK